MNIGLCGGTFDPFHRGHSEPIVAVRGMMEWSRVIYIPAYKQPFKTDREHASGYHRFAMAVLATEDIDFARVSPIELDRGAVSYTVDTLEELRGIHRDATLDWIIGDDNLADLPKWKNLDRIYELANFVVLTRGGPPHSLTQAIQPRLAEAKSRPKCGAVVFAPNATVPVSSTEIRRRIRSGMPIDDLVHPRVAHYIQQNTLYREAQT
jgi:nicotinate-nucleotide adenylyltransferase